MCAKKERESHRNSECEGVAANYSDTKQSHTKGARVFLSAALGVSAGLGTIAAGLAAPEDAAYAEEPSTVPAQSDAQPASAPEPVYLDSLNPTSSKVGFDRLRKDQNLSGRPLSGWINGKRESLSHGYFAHAPADIVFDVSQATQGRNIFTCYVGIDPDQGGDVTFRFYLDDSKTPVYTSGRVDRWSTQHINIDVTGAHKLRIAISDNGNSSQDHSFVAAAQFHQVDNLPEIQNVGELKRDFNQDIPTSQSDIMKSDNLERLGLLRLLDGRRDKLFSILVDHPEYKEAFEWLSKDPEALGFMMGQTPDGGNFDGFLKVLTAIYKTDPTIKTNSNHKRLAIATSLAFATPKGFWQNQSRKIEPVGRYVLYRNFYEEKNAMTYPMDDLNMSALRNVVSCWITNEDLIWLREKVKREHPAAVKSANDLSVLGQQYIKYRLYNDWGDSVQGGDYYGEDPDLQRIVEFGGVCGAISKFGVALMNAFGVPAQVVGQPAHAAMVYQNTDGNWSLQNSIYGWERSQGGTMTSFAYPGEGLWNRGPNAQFNSSYNNVEAAARKNAKGFRVAEVYYQMALVTTDPYQRRALLNSAIHANELYMPAYYQLITDEMRSSSPNEDALVATALRAFSLLDKHPKCAEDIAYAVEPYVKTQKNKIRFYSAIKGMFDRVVVGNPYTSDPEVRIMKTEEFRALVDKSYSLMGSFSFDGPHGGRLWGTNTEEEFSLDGGKTWIPIQIENQLLTQDQLQSLSAKHGIKLRLKGSSTEFTLPISQMQKPQTLKVLSDEHIILGITDDMEYSTDGGTTWYTTKDLKPNFLDTDRVLVRYRNSQNKLASPAAEYHFESGKLNANESILHAAVSIAGVSSEEPGRGEAAVNAINADTQNFWSNTYTGGDVNPSITFAFNEAYALKSFNYTPRQDGKKRGTITTGEVFTSMDGSSWTPAGKISWSYANPKEGKTFTFTSPVQARYVRIDISQALKDSDTDFGAVASMADIRFNTSAADAQAGRAALRKSLERAQADQLKETIAKLAEQVEKDREGLPNPEQAFPEDAYKDQVQTLMGQRAALSSALNSFAQTYGAVKTQDHSLTELEDLYRSARTQSEALNLQLRAYEQAYGTLSVAAGQGNLSKAEQERKALSDKIDAANNKIIADLEGRYADVFALDKQEYTDADLARMREAYYNLIGRPNAVTAHFADQINHLHQVLSSNQSREAHKEAQAFLKKHEWIIENADPASLTKDNWRTYADAFYACKKDYEALTPEAAADESLRDASVTDLFQWHPVISWNEEAQKPIFGSQEAFDYYFKPFQTREANQLLRKRYQEVKAYRNTLPRNTESEIARDAKLKESLKKAAEIAKNLELGSDDYIKAMSDLDNAYMEASKGAQNERDAVDRMVRFRNRFRDLLNMKPTESKPSDVAAIQGALKNYYKLPAYAREALKDDRAYLESMKQAASIPVDKRDQSLAFWKAQYAALMATKAASLDALPTDFQAHAKALLALKPQAESPAAYKQVCEEIEQGLTQLKNKSDQFILALDSYKTTYKELLKRDPSSFTLEDREELKALLKAAQDDLTQLESTQDIQVPSIQQILDAHAKRVAELDKQAQEKAEEEAAKRAEEEAAAKRAEEEAAAKKAEEEAAAKRAEEEAAAKRAEEEAAAKKAEEEAAKRAEEEAAKRAEEEAAKRAEEEKNKQEAENAASSSETEGETQGQPAAGETEQPHETAGGGTQAGGTASGSETESGKSTAGSEETHVPEQGGESTPKNQSDKPTSSETTQPGEGGGSSETEQPNAGEQASETEEPAAGEQGEESGATNQGEKPSEDENKPREDAHSGQTEQPSGTEQPGETEQSGTAEQPGEGGGSGETDHAGEATQPNETEHSSESGESGATEQPGEADHSGETEQSATEGETAGLGEGETSTGTTEQTPGETTEEIPENHGDEAFGGEEAETPDAGSSEGSKDSNKTTESSSDMEATDVNAGTSEIEDAAKVSGTGAGEVKLPAESLGASHENAVDELPDLDLPVIPNTAVRYSAAGIAAGLGTFTQTSDQAAQGSTSGAVSSVAQDKPKSEEPAAHDKNPEQKSSQQSTSGEHKLEEKEQDKGMGILPVVLGVIFGGGLTSALVARKYLAGKKKD